MTSVRVRQIYEDNKTYPILVKMGGGYKIVEMLGKQANKDNGMNGYNIDFAMSATLSAKVVEEMVRKMVEEQTGKKVDKVTANYIDCSSPQDRYSIREFNGYTVTFMIGSEETPRPQRGRYGDGD
jgi:hypothetical protein